MIIFNPLRTKRLSVNMRELSIDAAEALCLMPEQLEQACTTAMLRSIVVNSDDRPLPGQVDDPLLWTVQERTFVMAHYIAHTTEDGNPDFAVGDAGRFSDYLVDHSDYKDIVSLGLIDGDEIVMRPLLGFQAEAIERLVLGGRMKPNRLSWWVCAMACQMLKADEEPVTGLSDAEYTEWLYGRSLAFRELGESEFARLLHAFLDGTDALTHFFKISYMNTEIGIDPRQEGSKLPSARFPVRTAIRRSTLQILGIADQPAG